MNTARHDSEVAVDGARGEGYFSALRTVVCCTALTFAVSGCAVIGVASTAATLAVGGVSTAVDVGVGAVKVTGKVIGKGIDAATGPSATVPAAPVARAPAN